MRHVVHTTCTACCASRASTASTAKLSAITIYVLSALVEGLPKEPPPPASCEGGTTTSVTPVCITRVDGYVLLGGSSLVRVLAQIQVHKIRKNRHLERESEVLIVILLR